MVKDEDKGKGGIELGMEVDCIAKRVMKKATDDSKRRCECWMGVVGAINKALLLTVSAGYVFLVITRIGQAVSYPLVIHYFPGEGACAGGTKLLGIFAFAVMCLYFPLYGLELRMARATQISLLVTVTVVYSVAFYLYFFSQRVLVVSSHCG